MRTLLFFVASLLLTSLSVSAQTETYLTKEQVEQSIKDRDQLARDLKLTPDQQKKMGSITEKYKPQLAAIKSQFKQDEIDLHKIIKTNKLTEKQAYPLIQKYLLKVGTAQQKIREKSRKEIEAIFTPEQLKKVRAFQAKQTAMASKAGLMPSRKK